ncbi:MAG: hypothetical protein AUI14_21080 [Actinobacteria bacterium 13_2_20CM_2_71_6]|nr:MAG: hypothetical protein AUI14_21080 [Actinobacteria bacterium 13_2_20CM_2_71_6]
MVEVRPVGAGALDDVDALFATSVETDRCWCAWWLIPVNDYHAGGWAGNKALFERIVDTDEIPAGLLAYDAGTAVGWCAAGPRSRYARAVRTPTFRGRDPAEDASVWFVPCFYVVRDARRAGVARALLDGAVTLAREHGAIAVEGFPYAGPTRRSGGDVQVGVESLFASCGFTAIRRPSPGRVVMRRTLTD